MPLNQSQTYSMVSKNNFLAFEHNQAWHQLCLHSLLRLGRLFLDHHTRSIILVLVHSWHPCCFNSTSFKCLLCSFNQPLPWAYVFYLHCCSFELPILRKFEKNKQIDIKNLKNKQFLNLILKINTFCLEHRFGLFAVTNSEHRS